MTSHDRLISEFDSSPLEASQLTGLGQASMVHVATVGVIVHPLRDATDPLESITAWASAHEITVLCLESEAPRLGSSVVAVPEAELASRAELIVALGGDGTVLRALHLADGHSTPVLGVNLGKLGFLAEVDVIDLPSALMAMKELRYTIEQRGALQATVGGDGFAAFNDAVVVRVPGHGAADLELSVQGHHFVSYSADAVIVATPTGSTAYNFSAGGPVIDPSVSAIIVTPSAPHSVFNRSIVIEPTQSLSLRVLDSAGLLAMEIDGQVVRHVHGGETITVTFRERAARMVRLGGTTFYERTKRKLGIKDSKELMRFTDPGP